ncbi:Glucose/arabinose dehydrogenase, beta-propeller fold [Loktanella fryxellensis]|uniref:Glucose/arabinose dehydrogenase, beta-propeller fold n=1 Tax=Loktanella fryxellensis TaxID=245187 RepID=A0A1H8B2C8_9RHOB|nr:PQQ-dependent sugar dehydrogenase [Loktanella fryxellensis]SEM77085.1 Glucose/arabinose dehydrogenase, beta-propeller fold [Loktanella fryxellensis]
MKNRPISRLAIATALMTALPVAALAQAEAEPSATGEATPEAQVSVETSPPNAADQQPAFEGQTRAPQPANMPEVATATVATDLPQLWALEFLPDGQMLVTAKAGQMHVIDAEGTATEVTGVPEVDTAGQGGLLDVALAPDHAESGLIFFSFAEPRDGGNGTSVASARLVLDEAGGGTLEDVAVIFQQTPTYDGDKHFGSRLVFGPENELYVTVGERSDEEPRVQSQDLGSGLGKVFRITTEGEPFEGNPFIGTEGALPEIWSYGHRNTQSAALDAEGQLWIVEHGPLGGDELNRPEPGENYGWPEVTYGLEYSGDAVGDGITQQEPTLQPAYYWDPVIAPSGMAFYAGDEFPEWDGAALVGGLVTEGLVVLELDGDQVTTEQRVPLDARARDVKVGPDGAVYVVTEDRDAGTSEILRLTKG